MTKLKKVRNYERKIKLKYIWEAVLKKGKNATWLQISKAMTEHRKEINLTQGDLSQKGISTQPMISRFERGVSAIPESKTLRHWFDLLELEEVLEPERVEELLAHVDFLRVERNGKEEFRLTKYNLLRIPEYNVQASAGYGSFQGFEEVIEYHDIPTKFLPSLGVISPAIIQVVGDSMYPTISSGDHIIVQLDEGYKTDGVYLIRIDDTVHCKRLQRKFGTIRIISDSPLYEEIEVTGDDGNGFAILGKVLTTIRKF